MDRLQGLVAHILRNASQNMLETLYPLPVCFIEEL
jgi:hypothetical protein